jgi:methyl-accepting chemotaxis protein
MNASLVEEATAAATSMAGQAKELSHSVAQFRIEESAAGHAAPIMGRAPAASPLPAQAGGDRLAIPARREPVLAAADEDWKEF